MNKIVAVRVVVIVVLIMVLVNIGHHLIINKQKSLSQSPKFHLNNKPVKMTVAVKGSLKESNEYLAYIEAEQTAEVSARVVANVQKIFYREGEKVRAGDILAVLDDKNIIDGIAIIISQIKQAQAELAVSRQSLLSLRQTSKYWLNEKHRDKLLVDKNIISNSQFQATVEKYNVAQGKEQVVVKQLFVIENKIQTLKRHIDQLNTQKKYYTIISPYTGVISQCNIDIGDMVTIGKILFSVEDQSSIKLVFDIPQIDISYIKKGQAGFFTFDKETYEVTLSKVYPKLNKSRMLRAEAILKKTANKTLPLGAYITLFMTYNIATNKVVLPQSSIATNDRGEQYIYIVKNGKLNVNTVKVIASATGKVAVKGVKVGETVVLNSFLGWAKISNGMKVEAK